MSNHYHTIHVDKIPSVNHYVKHAKGRHYITADVAAFKRAVMAQLRASEPNLPKPIIDPIFKTDKNIGIHIIFGLIKNFYKRDLDNMIKVFIDCIATYYSFNDSRITTLKIEKKHLCKEYGKEMIDWRFI